MPSTPREERPAPPVDVALVPLVLAGAATFWLPSAAEGSSASRALAALALGALISLAFARDPFAAHPRVRWGMAGVLALVVWYFASRTWAIDPGGSVLEAGRIAAFGLGVYAAHVALIRQTSRVLALAAIGAAAVVVSAPDLWEVLRHGAPAVREAGFSGYWNATAIIALTLAPLSALLIRSRRFGLALLAGPLLAAAVSTAAVTASRGALAATIIGLVVVALLDSNRRLGAAIAVFVALMLGAGVALLSVSSIPGWVALAVVFVIGVNGAIGFRRVGLAPIPLDGDGVAAPKRLTPVRLAGGLICAAAAVVVIALAVHSSGARDTVAPAVERPASMQFDELPGVSRLTSTDDSRRSEWWHQSIDAWKDAPVRGEGGNAFSSLSALRADRASEHVHSSVLQLLLEVGIVGLLIALAIAAWLVRATLGATRTPERAVAAAIVAMVMAQSLIDWTLSLPQVMFVLVLACAVALPRALPARGEVPLAPLKVVFAALAGLALIAVVAVTPFAADLLGDQSARDLDAKRYAAAADHASQANVLMPTLDVLELRVAALEAADRPKEAARVLREAEPVWLHRPDGIAFAKLRLATDPEYGPIIEREAARQARILAATPPSS
ncbi:MAG: O-antigen ligase family protein [Thermoleophilia bacterium]|nr:O-antigen ligase family protein [Thermoleophilia bacterium]